MQEIQEKFKEIMNDPASKRKLFISIVLVGVIIVIASSTLFPSGEKQQAGDTKTDYTVYTDNLEEKLTDTISSISGVGSCKVMITLYKSSENVYAKNNDSKVDSDSKSESEEYVIYDGDNGESPILINEYFPNVQGVAVVCSGGDNPVVKEKVIETVSSLFSISSNRISVSKIKE